MSWHGFSNGDEISLEEIVFKNESRIGSKYVINKSEKENYLEQIKNSGYSRLVFTPSSYIGWGSSPLNPSNWRTLKGDKIV